MEAVDLDVGANGNVTYSLVQSSDRQGIDRFQIDATTGLIRTADVFDREARIGVTDLGVTVKAEDRGSPTLAGFCTFRVRIGDRNDNPPVFNLHQYSASIEESSPIGRRVKQVCPCTDCLFGFALDYITLACIVQFILTCFDAR